MSVVLRLTGRQQEDLHQHLFPGDGLEAVAVLLCGRRAGNVHALSVFKVHPVPYEVCERAQEYVTWPTEFITPLLDEAAAKGLALVKIHSHPGGYDQFSSVDDASDRELFPSVYAWVDDGQPHGSAIMLPDGRVIGRVVTEDGEFEPLARVAVAGDDIQIWFTDRGKLAETEATRRTSQAFGQGTTDLVRKLSVAVVGTSGTGGPLIEQLARYSVGELVLVDPDIVEEKNLNRIPNATMDDTLEGTPKVLVHARAVERMGLGTRVVPIDKDLHDPKVVKRTAECDLVFGCMDSVDGRHLLNKLASTYLLPYIDVGVKLVADGKGGIGFVGGSVHYLQPDGSSLLSRGVYTIAQLEAAALKRENPEEYEQRRREKYIQGVDEERPAVVSINTLMASLAVMELLARLHPYRQEQNAAYAVLRVDHTDGAMFTESEEEQGGRCRVVTKHAGRGDMRPLLGVPAMSQASEVAA